MPQDRFCLCIYGSSYISQQNLRQASSDALLFNLEKRASALSYFHSERKNDIKRIAEDPALINFFSNRALGMSMEYGLRASLLTLEERFEAIVQSRTLNHAPIYLRLLFIDNQGKHLVKVGLLKNNPTPRINETELQPQQITSLVIQDEGHIHSIALFPYFYKEKRMGTIFAEINRDEVMQYLIQTNPQENTTYAVLMADPKHILNNKHPKPQQDNVLLESNQKKFPDNYSSLTKIPVPGTPFILAAHYSPQNSVGTFLTSRWYLLSLLILSLLTLYSVVIRSRTRAHSQLLQKQFEEAEYQNNLFNEKNKRLKEEVLKRLNSEVRLQTVLETIPDLVWLKDPEGIYLSCNHKFERFFGALSKDIVGKSDHDFLPKELADFFREKDKAVIKAGIPLVNEETVTYADDDHKELLETIKTPLLDSEGNLIGVLGIARDITARKKAEEEFRYFSTHDPLTGLYNRRILEDRLTEEIHRAERYQHTLSIFMLDLDHFKRVNDIYGHQKGDLVLCHLAKLLEKSIRKTDYVARYGGEEFIIVLPETGLTEAKELAERLCTQIGEYDIPVSSHKNIQITASIGVACFPEHNKSWKELIKAADSAMYSAKQAGRNQVKSVLS